MTSVNEAHNQSMECAELAILARLRGEHEQAVQLFQESLRHELAAIEAVRTNPVEPTFSILHRSAATLALDCNDLRLAEKLITAALSGEPPAEISEELRDLLEQVYFRRHLQLHGLSLEEDEMQMSLAGAGVGFGIVHSSEFLERIEKASKMIYRIVDRRYGRPFRTSGRLPKTIKEDFEVFLSVPRAASFAVTLKLGRPVAQAQLPGVSDTANVIDEFMNLMGFLGNGDYARIADVIPDPAYRTNFIQLGKRLAPDGNDVSLVGFTAFREGRERYVEVVRPRVEITPPDIPAPTPDAKAQHVTVRGVLRYADATHTDSGQIKVVDDASSATHLVKVPEGMMGDIVKPLWECRVVVRGRKIGNYIHLEDIDEE